MPFIETKFKLEEFPAGQSTSLEVGPNQIGLFRTADGVFAIDNVCPHRGAPLHEGFVNDGMVTCPWHQWQFQLNDGGCRNIPKVKVASYPVEVRDGVIWIDVAGTGAPTP
jgi:nitrite reductase (NADH) small subunit/3-phenylpropionate/trans-cinnamate dioxygenase ferredoxin subunit